MEERNLKELDCSRMKIHPNSPQLVNFMEKNIPQLKNFKDHKGKVFNTQQIYRYIVLQYDPESPVQSMHALDWFGRKWESVAYAGFPMKKGRDGYVRFSQDVNDMVLGRNDDITDMVVLFIGWVNKYKWNHVVYLQEALAQHLRSAIGGAKQDIKTSKEVRELFNEINKTTEEMAMESEETDEFLSRFYFNIEKSRLAIRPEDFSKALADGDELKADNPFGVGYIVDKIKFLGDDESKV